MNYPTELAALPQWVCWHLEPDPKGGKARKVPYNPTTGRRASSTDPSSWVSLDQAMAAQQQYHYKGLGFVFTAESGIIGVDIDHCVDLGALNQIASEIVRRYPTYTEVSPSGTGLHLFYRGTFTAKGNKNSDTGVEMYAHSRFFTMTGNRLENTPELIADGTEALPWIHETYIVKQKPARKTKANKALRSYSLSDEQVLEKARSAQNAESFSGLWDGQWQSAYGSQSEADLALCCSLAFWTGKDPAQMDRLFRQSKLFREKWDIVHHADGATYGAETIKQALERTEDTYSPEGEPAILERNGRYYRNKGDSVYPLTNFIIRPLEMLISDEETHMTCDLLTLRGETFRQTFMTTDFSSAQKWKAVLNKRTIALSFSGSDADLEALKTFLSDLPWEKKIGVKALGLYHRDHGWIFVGRKSAFMADGKPVDDVVQLEKFASIDTDILSHDAIRADQLRQIGQQLLGYNEPAKTATVLGWCCGCFVKEMLRSTGIKYPHLFLIGEAGSGKSTTLERIILPIFGRSKVVAATQTTAFTLMKDAASSNLFPQALDEFKPSKIDRIRLGALYNHFRDSYDGHEGVRGRADQSQVSYALLAPMVIAGEESPDEPAIRERSMELLFSKKDLKDAGARAAFGYICGMRDALTSLGRGLLETALTLDEEALARWYAEAGTMFSSSLPSRTVNNLACCMVGLRLLERLCQRLGLSWQQVFTMDLAVCAKHIEYGVHEYLFDGGDSNKSVVEQTLEIMARMGLSDEECRELEEGKIAIHFHGVYDRFTQYRRDHAIFGECLIFTQFMKQLRKSDLYLETKTVRFADGPKKAAILNHEQLTNRCDVESFLHTHAKPLDGTSL